MPLVGPTTTFGFDGRGSRVSSTVAATQSAPAAVTSFAYTASGALASVVMPTTTVNYTSDARNLRQSRTVAGRTDLFTWSSVGGLPLLLDDGVHSYLYGPSSSPVAQVDDVTGVVQYLHADLLGTPRLLTDAGGAVAGTVSYDAFGNRATYTGTQSAIGFTGNWTDPDTGLLYLRARDYDPATGQFLTVDPAVDSTRQPYAYTGNNPVSRTDPTGLDAGEEVLAFLAGAADGASGGASSMLLGAFLPGYDCFIQKHNTAFQVGSIVTQVAVAVITIVGTAGAGAVLIAAKYAAAVGIKTAIKAGLKEAERLIVSAARRLASDDTGAIDFFATSSRRSVPDSSVIVRGGVSELPPPGQTFSGAFGSSLDEAAAGVPHGQLVSTTAGDIRAGGGSVQHAPEFNENVGLVNNQHVDVTLGRNSAPFGELSANPVPKPGRFGGPDYPYSSWSD